MAIWTGWRTEAKDMHDRLHAYLLLTCLHARMLACVPSDKHSLTPHVATKTFIPPAHPKDCGSDVFHKRSAQTQAHNDLT